MEYTISTHVGAVVARGHNIRDKRITSVQSHINPNGEHETWHDETEVKAYHRLFDAAQTRYNARQTRKNKIIDNYYQTVKKSGRGQNTAYEMIITVGNKDNAPDPTVGKTVMRAFVDGWAERNPNMEMIGAYYHADEEGVPHVHIDFVPVAHNFKRGMDTQTSYNKALAEMGYTGRLAGANWWANENQTLEHICNDHGLEVEHPKEGLSHLDTELYKLAEGYVKQAKDNIYAMSGINEEIEQTEEKTRFGKTIPATTTMLTTNFEKMMDINVLLNQADAIVERLQTSASTTTLVKNERIAKNAAESDRYDKERENIKLGAKIYKLENENKEIREEWEKCAKTLEDNLKQYKTLEDNLEQYKEKSKSLQEELNNLKEQQEVHKAPAYHR